MRVLTLLLMLLATSVSAQETTETPVESDNSAAQTTEKATETTQSTNDPKQDTGPSPSEADKTTETAAESTETTETPSVTPRVTATLEPESVVVGQPAVLRVSVLVPTWLPQPPAFPSFEAPNMIVRLPERASGPVSERVEGETWSGVSRAYRLYPMVPGEVVLPAQSITVTFADPETTQPVIFEAELPAVTLMATIPDGAEGLDPMILASGFTLEQSVEGAEDTLGAGDAALRSVTATISGTSPLFIPPLVPGVEGEAVKAYPKDPVVREQEERGKLSGSRTESVTYVAQYGGTVELPEIAIDWFNIETGEVETATVEGATLVVDAPAAPVAPRLTARQIAVLLAGGALTIAILWLALRFLFPRMRARRAAREATWLASEEHAAGEVELALAARDLSALVPALARWSARCPGDEAALEEALAAIGAERFGPAGGQNGGDGWKAMRKAFREERKRRKAGDVRAVLPQLNPTVATASR